MERAVPPQADVYKCIVFRAADIKDLKVNDAPPAAEAAYVDPAIVSMVVCARCVVLNASLLHKQLLLRPPPLL